LQLPCHPLDQAGSAVELGWSVLKEHNSPLAIVRLGDNGLVGVGLGVDRSLARWNQSSNGSLDHRMRSQLTNGLHLDGIAPGLVV
jgi:hypothetical protein